MSDSFPIFLAAFVISISSPPRVPNHGKPYPDRRLWWAGGSARMENRRPAILGSAAHQFKGLARRAAIVPIFATDDRLQTALMAVAVSPSTYLGGTGIERATAVAVDQAGYVYVAGLTDSPDFPVLNAFNPRVRGVDAFVAKWDPAMRTVVYCTYLGGSGDDRAFGLAVDASGNAYVTGWTASADFPAVFPLQRKLSGWRDAFVVKLGPSGDLLYSTFLGGSGIDSGSAIAVNADGEVYVAGTTDSIDFPVVNALQNTRRGQSDFFVAKLNAGGAQLIYSTYLGGSAADQAQALAVDGAGNAYVAGSTASPDFPIANAFQTQLRGNQDAFVAKLAPSGNSLVFATYFGGGGFALPEIANGIALDAAGNACIAGVTGSTDLPIRQPAQAAHRGGQLDAFALKLAADGRSAIFSTYLGGVNLDIGTAAAVNASGECYVAGYSTSKDFPVLQAVQPGYRGSYDAFIARFSNSGALVESTFLGGSDSDAAYGIAVSGSSVYAAGETTSRDFPVNSAVQATNRGILDAFVTRIGPSTLFEGYHDRATCSAIEGWAWNRFQPDSPIDVTIWDGASLLARVTASRMRWDLLAAGIGNGAHGFTYPVDARLFDGASHTIRIKAAENGADLLNTPQTIRCERLLGYQDAASCDGVEGWAWSPTQPNAAFEVEIYDGSTLLGIAKADRFRGDLLQAGIGNGYHSFRFNFGSTLGDGSPHSIGVRIAGTAIALAGGPKLITCNRFEGFYDNLTCGSAAGWAWNRSQPAAVVNVDVVEAGAVIATVPANQFRGDLLAAGKGNGYHGFVFNLAALLADGKTHSISTRISPSGPELPPGPKTVKCP